MEIPTDKIIEAVQSVPSGDTQDEVIKIIKAQALEIVELQAGICRLREEMQKMHHNEHRAIEILVHGDGE